MRALEAHAAGPLTVTLKSLQGPPIQLQLSREDRIDDVRARACAAAGTRPGWSAAKRVSSSMADGVAAEADMARSSWEGVQATPWTPRGACSYWAFQTTM